MLRNSKSNLEAAESDSVIQISLNIPEYPTVRKIRQSQTTGRFSGRWRPRSFGTIEHCTRANLLSRDQMPLFLWRTCQSDTMSNAEKTQKNDIGQSKSGMYQHFDSEIFRIMDAALNRAAEGLRVVEDFCRLGLDDGFLARELKELRHLLVEACAVIDSKSRLQYRDSELDVGRSIQTSSEYQRQSIESIIRSNMSRVQQATRTIEEYSKLNFPAATQAIEQVRYRSYTIEKAGV